MLLVRDAYECEPMGESELRGHAPIKTYAVVGAVASSGEQLNRAPSEAVPAPPNQRVRAR
jgi:hypothetical protein